MLEVGDGQTSKGTPEQPQEKLLLQDVQIHCYRIPLPEAEHDLDDSGQATGEDQAGGGAFVEHAYPSSEEFMEPRPFHNQEKESHTCSVIGIYHVAASCEEYAVI